MAPKKKDLVAVKGVKKKSIADFDGEITKKYGATVQVGSLQVSKDIVSSGSLTMDIASGIGGIPRSRIIEISGMPSTGKTYRALMIGKNIQKAGGRIAFIDTEFATDEDYLESLGIDISPEKWRTFYPENLEVAGELAVDIAESGLYHGIIFDSVGGAPFSAQQEGEIGDAYMMVRAKLMSTFMPKLNGPVYKQGLFMIFTNQLRNKPDQYDPYFAPGGNALPFHASMRVFLRSRVEKEDKATDTKDVERVLVAGEFKKNKCAPPFRKFEYNLDFDAMETDYIGEMAITLTNPKHLGKLGIERAAAWYNLPEDLSALGLPAKINGFNKFDEELRKELNETGSTEVIDAVDKYIRTKLIKNFDPNYVLSLGDPNDYVPDVDFYEGSEEGVV